MYVKKINIKDIKFRYTCYNESLKNSILKVKLIKYIKVMEKDGYYQCVDGHKRLSCIQDYSVMDEVMCVVENDYSKQGSSYWGSKNHH